jgi:hypothetical protein
MTMKYFIVDMPSFSDALFVCVVIVFMYVQNAMFMSAKCASSSSVFSATLIPWVMMFIPLLVCLRLFPEWKRPFSNTFGYVVARVAGGTSALLELIDTSQRLEYVYQDPSILLNQFSPERFDQVLASLSHVLTSDVVKIDRLRKIVRLKDLVSEWIWLILGASVATSTSYTMMMRMECTASPDDMVTAHSVAMAKTVETEEETQYVITE